MALSVLLAARAGAGQVAIVSQDQVLRYEELAQRVDRACYLLARRGLGPGARAALSATNRVETLVMLLAFLEVGVPVVPIHPRWTSPEVAVLLADASPAYFLGDADVDEFLDDADAVPASALWSGRAAVDPTRPLAILYTSGTTGTPKGAVLPRAAFVASASGSAANLGWREGDRWLLCLPLCHIGGLSVLTRCLLARRTLVLMERYDAAEVLCRIERDHVTLLSVVPTMLRGLLQVDQRGVLRRLRAVLCGGAAAPFELIEQAAAHGVQVLTTYGLTEACSQVTVQPLLPKPLARRGVGGALPGVEISIRSAEDEALGPGVPGRICVRGQTMMDGYLHHPPLRGAWFDTGDVGEVDGQGSLHVHARRVDMIVRGGENVYPTEVEQALAKIPGVAHAVVFGVPDPRWGALVAAAVVPGTGWDEAVFQQGLLALASFKRPRLLALIEQVPELSIGKPDRRRLIEQATPSMRALKDGG